MLHWDGWSLPASSSFYIPGIYYFLAPLHVYPPPALPVYWPQVPLFLAKASRSWFTVYLLYLNYSSRSQRFIISLSFSSIAVFRLTISSSLVLSRLSITLEYTGGFYFPVILQCRLGVINLKKVRQGLSLVCFIFHLLCFKPQNVHLLRCAGV